MSLRSAGGNKMVTSKNYIGGIPRTLVSRDLPVRATFRAGELFPFYVEEVLPATNKSVKQGSFIRSITPLGPTMDNAFLDVMYFFVPWRLVWDHFEEYIAGYNKEAWAQDVTYTKPKIKFKIPETYDYDKHNEYIGSWLDHVPGMCDVVALHDSFQVLKGLIDGEVITAVEAEKRLNYVFQVDALYARAYVKIWNDWFRDENLQDEIELYTGDSDEYADEFAFNLLSGAVLPKAAKYHNRFTTALPRPTKGPDVLIPMNDLQVGLTPSASVGDSGATYMRFTNGLAGQFTPATSINSGVASVNGKSIVANNVSNTIRMLRLATQTELLLARDARGGTRYIESLLAHFGTHNGNASLQRSEYLGSRQIPLNVTQVTNTAQSAAGVLGNVGGQSVTRDVGHMFNKAFTEHGCVIGLAVVRTNLSYGSGRRKQFTRFSRFEEIWPEFRHVGDVELMKTELDQSPGMFTEGDPAEAPVFGFTPYGSELREGYHANTGLFRARASGSYAYLTYQEEYDPDAIVTLGESYIEQSDDVVARTLIEQSTDAPQFYAQFTILEEQAIPLDPTSDPGLMDHF